MARKPQLNRIICGDWVEVLRSLPDNYVHCCVTSPPYWGQRNYGVEGQLGLEKTPEEHIDNLVAGFREFRRVLRDDGVLWLNYGDKYGGGNNKGSGLDPKMIQKFSSKGSGTFTIKGRDGNLLMLPARVALALQADGWLLRSDIIWAKAISFGPHQCPHCGKELIIEGPDQNYLFEDEFKEKTISHKKSGSTMPESVNGSRWERHKIKVKKSKRAKGIYNELAYEHPQGAVSGGGTDGRAQWRLCPGCSKCNPNDGWVQRCGSWRPTSAHEHLFLLTKTDRYFCDAEAVREEQSGNTHISKSPTGGKKAIEREGRPYFGPTQLLPSGRNLRNVWCINPKPYKYAHYATFPPDLVIPCIKAGTSEKGCCPKCGAPWARMVTSPSGGAIGLKGGWYNFDRSEAEIRGNAKNVSSKGYIPSTTLGWRPTCKCKSDDLDQFGKPIAFEPVPCIVYDPFMGSGTVAAEAAKLGRNYLGSELNEEYLNEQAKYRVLEAETGVTVGELKEDGQIPLF